MIVVGTEHWSQRVDRAANRPIVDPNLAYALHFYAGSHDWRLRRRARKALARGVAIFVTEWGLSKADGNGRLNLAEAERWFRFLQNRGVSDVNWSIMDREETSAALWPKASASGGWASADLTPSGGRVRDRLRDFAGRRLGPSPFNSPSAQ